MSRKEKSAVTATDRHRDGVRLLQDIIAIFHQRNADRLRTSVLIECLCAVEGWGWSGQYLHDAQKLARLLRPFRIRSKQFRFSGRLAWGYTRQCFEQALRRLPPYDGKLG